MTSNHFIVLPLVLGIVATAAMAHPEGSSPPEAAGAAAQAPTGDARRVVRDPVTGRLRAPTDEEIAAENARTGYRGPGAPLSVRVHPNGMTSAVLGPDYMVTLKAERRADGSLAVTHGKARDEHAHAHGQTAAADKKCAKPDAAKPAAAATSTTPAHRAPTE